MGMSIDKAIKLMIRGSKYDYDGSAEDFCEAYDMSIEIMRKYKKIEEILDQLIDSKIRTYDAVTEIEDIVFGQAGAEDGNDD